MAVSRLPTVGGDSGAWGTVLNDWLGKNVSAQQFCVDSYGADPTGATSSDDAWDACYAAAVASLQSGAQQSPGGALIRFGRGIYTVSVNKIAVDDIRIGLVGSGKSVTTLRTAGNTGDLVSVTDTSGMGTAGAPVGGFHLHGWSAGAAVNGLHYGDRDFGTVFDIDAQGFQGSGARGFYFHGRNAQHSEGTSTWGLNAGNSDVGFDFDGGGFQGSSDYGWWNLHFHGNGTAVRWANGAHCVGGHVSLRGNVGGGGAGAYSAAAKLLQVGSSGSDTAKISGTELTIGVEADAGSTTITDFTIQGTDGYCGIVGCYGSIYLLNYSGTFNAGSVTAPAVFQVDGPISDACYTVAQSAGQKFQLGHGLTGFNSQDSGGMYFGSGAPASGLGSVGAYYFRSDTPSTTNQRIYVKTGASTWTGVV